MAWSGVKTVFFDITGPHTAGTYVGLRQVEFLLNGEVVLPAIERTILTSLRSSYYTAYYIFETYGVTGPDSQASWMSGTDPLFLPGPYDQRVGVVFEEPIDFDEIRINNYHNSGTDTGSGADNVLISVYYGAQDDNLDTFGWVYYNEYRIFPNGTSAIFEDTIPEHVASDVEDPFYTFSSPVPSFSPKSGNYYPGGTDVTISAPGTDTIYYTTDGSEPTTGSSVYSTPISITDEMVIKAFSVTSGSPNSSVVESLYLIKAIATEAMTGTGQPSGSATASSTLSTKDPWRAFDQEYGSFSSWYSAIPTTPVWIQYEFDFGTTIDYMQFYTPNSEAYSYPGEFIIQGSNNGVDWDTLLENDNNLQLSQGEFTKIFELVDPESYTHYRMTMNSLFGPSSNTYASMGEIHYFAKVLAPKVDAPEVTPISGDYPSTEIITMTTDTAGATIYYTEDGSVPDATDIEYIVPFELTVDKVIKAIAILSGYIDSNITSRIYGPQVEDPSITPGSGAYASTQLITITTATSGATIYYTEDGSVPDETDTEYTAPFALTSAKTIRAIGIKDGSTDSNIAVEVYTILEVKVSTPIITPTSGAYSSTQLITITTTTDGDTIYYTEDGSTPDATDTEYTVPFELTAAKTIKAIGIKSGITDSDIATEVYTIITGVLDDIIVTDNGTWLLAPTSYTYQWTRDDIDILDETNYYHIVVAADVGTRVLCVVTAINSGGSASEPSNGIDIV